MPLIAASILACLFLMGQGQGAETDRLFEFRGRIVHADGVEMLFHDGQHQKQDFLDSVRRRSPTVNPVESVVRSDAISHLSDRAIRLGRKIRWDPAEEKKIGDGLPPECCPAPCAAPGLSEPSPFPHGRGVFPRCDNGLSRG